MRFPLRSLFCAICVAALLASFVRTQGRSTLDDTQPEAIAAAIGEDAAADTALEAAHAAAVGMLLDRIDHFPRHQAPARGKASLEGAKSG